MEDNELKNLFSKLKKEENNNIPDFDLLLNRPIKEKVRAISLNPILKWSAAAAILLLISVISYQYLNNIDSNKLAEHISEEKENILNWEAETDILLPTEFTDSEVSEKDPKIIVISKKEEMEVVEKNPELKEDLYQFGAISDWTPPSDALMPFDNYSDIF